MTSWIRKNIVIKVDQQLLHTNMKSLANQLKLVKKIHYHISQISSGNYHLAKLPLGRMFIGRTFTFIRAAGFTGYDFDNPKR